MMTYTCAACGKTFESDWTDEEALAEREKHGWSDVNCAVVCDDCYREMSTWDDKPNCYSPQRARQGGEMSELYLILHKVRGKPAFDVAERIMTGDEEEWVIPTSGHRAYPIATWPLADLDYKGIPAFMSRLDKYLIPDDWPDHYDTSST